MSKAIRIHAVGGPDALVFEDVEPGSPGAGQVLIRQHAVGLNFIDVYHRTGLYPLPLPFVPGSEGAGEVVNVGTGRGTRIVDLAAMIGGLVEHVSARREVRASAADIGRARATVEEERRAGFTHSHNDALEVLAKVGREARAR